MSALSPKEQELFDAARAAVPRFLFQKDDAPQELFAAFAKVLGLSRAQVDSWLTMTLIGSAVGFWLDQHAIDRGMRRQASESDAALAARVRAVDDVATLPALQAKVSAILTADGVAGVGAICELRKSCANLGQTYARIRCPAAAKVADGETFTLVDSVPTSHVFEFDKDSSVAGGHVAVDVSAAVTAADVAAAVLAAIAGDASPSWAAVSPAPSTGDPASAYLMGASASTAAHLGAFSDTVADAGFSIATGTRNGYLSRGYRAGIAGNTPEFSEFIVILPFGTSAATAAAVRDAMRLFKGGGVRFQVERRTSP